MKYLYIMRATYKHKSEFPPPTTYYYGIFEKNDSYYATCLDKDESYTEQMTPYTYNYGDYYFDIITEDDYFLDKI